MTVIVQDDHLTAGAWAACGLPNLCFILEVSAFKFGIPCFVVKKLNAKFS